MPNDMKQAIIPKSDQLNADDLLSGPITIRITGVTVRGGQEQPVAISYEGDNGKPYKACKSMCRILVSAWGPDSSKYVGRSLTLYRDPSVKWGGLAVGGIRISHMSHIPEDMTMALTVTRANRKPFTVRPLNVAQPKASGAGTQPAQEPLPPAAAPDAAGADRAADRLVDAEAIAGCTTEPELTALVKGMLASAKGDTERKAWIKDLGNARDAELTEAFKQ